MRPRYTPRSVSRAEDVPISLLSVSPTPSGVRVPHRHRFKRGYNQPRLLRGYKSTSYPSVRKCTIFLVLICMSKRSLHFRIKTFVFQIFRQQPDFSILLTWPLGLSLAWPIVLQYRDTDLSSDRWRESGAPSRPLCSPQPQHKRLLSAAAAAAAAAQNVFSCH